MSYLNSIKKLLSRLKNYQYYPFYFGWSSFRKVYLSFHPDSYLIGLEHQEFDHLFNGFVKHNKFNNSGDITRLWGFVLNIKNVLSENIEGDFAELGVWRGNTSHVLGFYAKSAGRKLFLFDTFQGFSESDLVGVDSTKDVSFSDTSVEVVKKIVGNSLDACEFVVGHFPESASNIDITKRFAVVSLDCDLYAPMIAGLNFFYERMNIGAIFLLHDYSSGSWDGAKKAIDEFCKKNNERIVLLPDKSGSAFLRKSH